MKLALISDSHFDEHSRFAECIAIHSWIASQCAARGVDLVLHGGDVYERKSTPRERDAVAAWVQSLAAIAPVVIVRGNHDALDDLPLLRRLQGAHPVTVVESCAVVEAGGAVIACIGWPNKAHILARGAESHDASEAAAGDALRNVIRSLGDQMHATIGGRPMPAVMLAHAMVRGSRVSVGQPLVGCDLEVGTDDLRMARADLYALGHIHMAQAWRAGDAVSRDLGTADMVYPGSPRRTSYGETEPKSFVVATFGKNGRLIDCEYVTTPATPMVHVDGVYVPGDAWVAGHVRAQWDQSTVTGAEVRLRYAVATEHRVAAKSAAADEARSMRTRGAVFVKVEERVDVTTRSRAPELATANTLAAKLDAYWRARGTVPTAEQRAALITKLETIDTAEVAL